MDRDFIIAEIRRTAEANGGKPLGRGRFEKEAGIKTSDWSGIHWAKWNDAVVEAGFTPNKMQKSFDEEYVIIKFIELVRELGKFPTRPELGLKKRRDSSYPSHRVFTRLGKKFERAEKIMEYCRQNDGFEDVEAICRDVLSAQPAPESADEGAEISPDNFGQVYLLKSGKYFKIGFSNSAGRREYELKIQLPEKAEMIHVISTDDPAGIEAYWHKRFKDRHKNGEWFELSQGDVKAFRRRKFM